MDRYYLFQKLLALLADDAEITNAKMKDYSNDIEITAVCGEQEIKVRVSLSKEDAEDA